MKPEHFFVICFIFIIFLFANFLSYTLGHTYGMEDMREASRKNLIELKMAHYEVDAKTGKTIFTLHTPEKK